MKRQIAIAIVAATLCADIASGQSRHYDPRIENAKWQAEARQEAKRQAEAQAKRYSDAKASNAAAGAAQVQQDAINSTNIIAKQSAAKEKALQLNQAQAATNNAYGLVRMGERYRDGDGVPKDAIKAREYFSKAVVAG